MEFITAKAVNEWVGAPELAHLSPVPVKGIVTTLQLALEKRFGRGAVSSRRKTRSKMILAAIWWRKSNKSSRQPKG